MSDKLPDTIKKEKEKIPLIIKISETMTMQVTEDGDQIKYTFIERPEFSLDDVLKNLLGNE